jgi:polysaccharide biosynthesis/export protein
VSMIKRWIAAGRAAAAVFGLAVSSVGAVAQSQVAGVATAAAPAVASAVASPAAAPAPAEYRLATGDLLRITVFQSPELTLEARLADGGLLSYPLLGALRLGGLGVAAAERLIADGLRSGGFVRNPQVTVALLQARGQQVSVLGQVNRPGRYALEAGELRLVDLLALAGGTANGGSDRVIVTGQREGQPYRAEVDLPAVFDSTSAQRDLLVRDGDVVWVERQPLVYIYGEVQRPGALRLERGMTLMQALASGGGLTPRGTERGIRVHRRAAAPGPATTVELRLTDALYDGDVVHVRESLF